MRGTFIVVAGLFAMATCKVVALAQQPAANKLLAYANPAIQEQFNRTWPAFVEKIGAAPEGLCGAYCELRTLESQTEDKYDC
jgi:hypothetical protein